MDLSLSRSQVGSSEGLSAVEPLPAAASNHDIGRRDERFTAMRLPVPSQPDVTDHCARIAENGFAQVVPLKKFPVSAQQRGFLIRQEFCRNGYFAFRCEDRALDDFSHFLEPP